MSRRLAAYAAQGVQTFPIPVKYNHAGRAREKGVDVRLAIDLVRFARKGLFDVAIIVRGMSRSLLNAGERRLP